MLYKLTCLFIHSARLGSPWLLTSRMMVEEASRLCGSTLWIVLGACFAKNEEKIIIGLELGMPVLVSGEEQGGAEGNFLEEDMVHIGGQKRIWLVIAMCASTSFSTKALIILCFT